MDSLAVKLIKSPKTRLVIPEEMGTPNDHQLKSTELDNLIELAGRVCYDSLGSPKSRSSVDYHKHIIEVNHGSVQEHSNITIAKSFVDNSCLLCFLNKPGFFVTVIEDQLRITGNIRAIREWNNKESDIIGTALKTWAFNECPLALYDMKTLDPCGFYSTDPILDEEIWISFFFDGVSRGFSHELVRHKWHTAVSQRSTRYVDESKSKWIWHPVIDQYRDELNERLSGSLCNKLYNLQISSATNMLDVSQFIASNLYDQIVSFLQEKIKESESCDNFTARKQARAAARGILGNALNTSLIFSASLDQWKRMILMRASAAADAEIRVVFNKVFEQIAELYPGKMDNFCTRKVPDGIGYEIFQR